VKDSAGDPWTGIAGRDLRPGPSRLTPNLPANLLDEGLVTAATVLDQRTLIIVPLDGDAGLRRGENDQGLKHEGE
jgi:hypothetical protein